MHTPVSREIVRDILLIRRNFKFSSLIIRHNVSIDGTRGSGQPFHPRDLQLLAGKLDYNDAGTPQARIVVPGFSLNDNHLPLGGRKPVEETMRSLLLPALSPPPPFYRDPNT